MRNSGLYAHINEIHCINCLSKNYNIKDSLKEYTKNTYTNIEDRPEFLWLEKSYLLEELDLGRNKIANFGMELKEKHDQLVKEKKVTSNLLKELKFMKKQLHGQQYRQMKLIKFILD